MLAMEVKDRWINSQEMCVAESDTKSRIITIISGKRGVGKTNIAVNLSMALAKFGKSVTLLDADTSSANMQVLLGIEPKSTMDDVLRGEKTISDITIVDPSGIRVISANSGGDSFGGKDYTVKDQMLHEICKLQNANDFLLIDTSTDFSETVVDFALRADEVIVVITPELMAVSDAYGLLKILFGMKESIQFKTIINFAKSKDEAEEVFEMFLMVAHYFLNVEIEYLGFVLQDNHVQTAVKIHSPLLRSFPGCEAAKCFHQIALRMLS